MFRRMLIGMLAIVALAAAPAAAQYSFVVTPSDVGPNGQVTASGKGYGPGETVEVHWAPAAKSTSAKADDPDGPVVATGTTDADGNFTITFPVPAGTAPGTYTVTAVCVDSKTVQRANVVVSAATVTPTTATSTTTGSGTLVRTGSNLNGFGLAGAGLLLAGGVFLLASRRRRQLA
jgi:LPXTG-motif cell wall-anchored protein